MSSSVPGYKQNTFSSTISLLCPEFIYANWGKNPNFNPLIKLLLCILTAWNDGVLLYFYISEVSVHSISFVVFFCTCGMMDIPIATLPHRLHYTFLCYFNLQTAMGYASYHLCLKLHTDMHTVYSSFFFLLSSLLSYSHQFYHADEHDKMCKGRKLWKDKVNFSIESTT